MQTVNDSSLDAPVLYILSGLPGSGKTTIGTQLGTRLRAAYVRIDTIEQGLRDVCSIQPLGEGYALAYRVAADNLRVGMDVVADSCNPIDMTRREWERVASTARAKYVNIELVCSDPNEHRRRVESRESSIAGLKLPTWSEVEQREYSRWTSPRVVIDTAGRSEGECLEELLSRLASWGD